MSATFTSIDTMRRGMSSKTPMPRSHQVAWTLMAVGYVTLAVVFSILWFGHDTPTRPAEQPATDRPVIQVPANAQTDECQAFLKYAEENGLPTGPDDPSYVEWKRLRDACEATK